jgi:predicted DNA-binding ribbon-helix-helix protein
MGRKALEVPKIRVSVRIDSTAYTELENLARKQGRTVANLISFLAEQEATKQQDLQAS